MATSSRPANCLAKPSTRLIGREKMQQLPAMRLPRRCEKLSSAILPLHGDKRQRPSRLRQNGMYSLEQPWHWLLQGRCSRRNR